MPNIPPAPLQFNIMVVGQKGRIQYEALLFAASLRTMSPAFSGRLIVAEPQPGPLWPDDPRMDAPLRDALRALGAEIAGFQNHIFGASYPYGNKIEGLVTLPADAPFIFFDSDTLVLDELSALPIDFAYPTASMRREGTWPQEDVYWPGHTATWKSLYDRFELDFASSLDLSQPDEYWQRYLYFNAGWFLGADPARFGARFGAYARTIRDDTPETIKLQPLDPWLDQVALPLVIHSLGGGRPGPELAGLDGDVTCHYRMFPMLYARESDRAIAVLEQVSTQKPLRKLLRDHAPIRRMVYQGNGRRVRALFDRNALPPREAQIRNLIRKHGLWMR